MRFRKPIPPPDRVMRPRKEHSREKDLVRESIEEGIKEYEEEGVEE